MLMFSGSGATEPATPLDWEKSQKQGGGGGQPFPPERRTKEKESLEKRYIFEKDEILGGKGIAKIQKVCLCTKKLSPKQRANPPPTRQGLVRTWNSGPVEKR